MFLHLPTRRTGQRPSPTPGFSPGPRFPAAPSSSTTSQSRLPPGLIPLLLPPRGAGKHPGAAPPSRARPAAHPPLSPLPPHSGISNGSSGPGGPQLRGSSPTLPPVRAPPVPAGRQPAAGGAGAARARPSPRWQVGPGRTGQPSSSRNFPSPRPRHQLRRRLPGRPGATATVPRAAEAPPPLRPRIPRRRPGRPRGPAGAPPPPPGAGRRPGRGRGRRARPNAPGSPGGDNEMAAKSAAPGGPVAPAGAAPPRAASSSLPSPSPLSSHGQRPLPARPPRRPSERAAPARCPRPSRLHLGSAPQRPPSPAPRSPQAAPRRAGRHPRSLRSGWRAGSGRVRAGAGAAALAGAALTGAAILNRHLAAFPTRQWRSRRRAPDPQRPLAPARRHCPPAAAAARGGSGGVGGTGGAAGRGGPARHAGAANVFRAKTPRMRPAGACWRAAAGRKAAVSAAAEGAGRRQGDGKPLGGGTRWGGRLSRQEVGGAGGAGMGGPAPREAAVGAARGRAGPRCLRVRPGRRRGGLSSAARPGRGRGDAARGLGSRGPPGMGAAT